MKQCNNIWLDKATYTRIHTDMVVNYSSIFHLKGIIFLNLIKKDKIFSNLKTFINNMKANDHVISALLKQK